MQRVRTVETRSRNDARRNSYPRLNAKGPLRTYPEIARMTGLSEAQVKRAETNAFRKIRAALFAYGYKDPNK